MHDAFGLMSLDDPAVLAGMAADGQPFFSDPHAAHNQDMDTPMPTKRLGGAAGAMQLHLPPMPSREQDTRELRDFWRQYMRTPLSGPALDAATASVLPGLGGSGQRKRVASLPSVKTPVVERDHMYAPVTVGGNANQVGNPNAGGAGGTSSIRTTLHGQAEDLRSYEAAVMARKAPTTLKLQAKRKQQGGDGGPVRDFY